MSTYVHSSRQGPAPGNPDSPTVKRYLAIAISMLIAFGLTCAAPKEPEEHPASGDVTITVPPAAPTASSSLIHTPTTPSAVPSRRGSVRLADDRSAPIVPVVPRDLISAVFNPVHIRSAEVGEQVGESSLVIGVSIGSESVAYSVSYLSSREIVNDTVGGTPIAVTW